MKKKKQPLNTRLTLIGPTKEQWSIDIADNADDDDVVEWGQSIGANGKDVLRGVIQLVIHTDLKKGESYAKNLPGGWKLTLSAV